MRGGTDGTVSMFDLDTWSSRMYPGYSPAPAKTKKAGISKSSSPKSSGSSSRMPLMCLCLTRATGPTPGVSTISWADGPLPTKSTMLNTGAFRNEGDGLLSLPISTDSLRRTFYLTLNCGEKPRVPNPTKLSQILEPNADQKYYLSAKACQGILNRAERRGKELPEALLKALVEQAASLSKNEQEDRGGGKGILLQHEHTGALSTLRNQYALAEQ